MMADLGRHIVLLNNLLDQFARESQSLIAIFRRVSEYRSRTEIQALAAQWETIHLLTNTLGHSLGGGGDALQLYMTQLGDVIHQVIEGVGDMKTHEYNFPFCILKLLATVKNGVKLHVDSKPNLAVSELQPSQPMNLLPPMTPSGDTVSEEPTCKPNSPPPSIHSHSPGTSVSSIAINASSAMAPIISTTEAHSSPSRTYYPIASHNHPNTLTSSAQLPSSRMQSSTDVAHDPSPSLSNKSLKEALATVASNLDKNSNIPPPLPPLFTKPMRSRSKSAKEGEETINTQPPAALGDMKEMQQADWTEQQEEAGSSESARLDDWETNSSAADDATYPAEITDNLLPKPKETADTPHRSTFAKSTSDVHLTPEETHIMCPQFDVEIEPSSSNVFTDPVRQRDPCAYSEEEVPCRVASNTIDRIRPTVATIAEDMGTSGTAAPVRQCDQPVQLVEDLVPPEKQVRVDEGDMWGKHLKEEQFKDDGLEVPESPIDRAELENSVSSLKPTDNGSKETIETPNRAPVEISEPQSPTVQKPPIDAALVRAKKLNNRTSLLHAPSVRQAAAFFEHKIIKVAESANSLKTRPALATSPGTKRLHSRTEGQMQESSNKPVRKEGSPLEVVIPEPSSSQSLLNDGASPVNSGKTEPGKQSSPSVKTLPTSSMNGFFPASDLQPDHSPVEANFGPNEASELRELARAEPDFGIPKAVPWPVKSTNSAPQLPRILQLTKNHSFASSTATLEEEEMGDAWQVKSYDFDESEHIVPEFIALDSAPACDINVMLGSRPGHLGSHNDSGGVAVTEDPLPVLNTVSSYPELPLPVEDRKASLHGSAGDLAVERQAGFRKSMEKAASSMESNRESDGNVVLLDDLLDKQTNAHGDQADDDGKLERMQEESPEIAARQDGQVEVPGSLPLSQLGTDATVPTVSTEANRQSLAKRLTQTLQYPAGTGVAPFNQTRPSRQPTLLLLPLATHQSPISLQLPLSENGHRLGRGNPRPDFTSFTSQVVSRNHCDLFSACNDGIWRMWLQDCGSNSGTFLNGVRLSEAGLKSEKWEVKSGDFVQLGKDFEGNVEGVPEARRKCVKLQLVVSPDGKDVTPRTSVAESSTFGIVAREKVNVIGEKTTSINRQLHIVTSLQQPGAETAQSDPSTTGTTQPTGLRNLSSPSRTNAVETPATTSASRNKYVLSISGTKDKVRKVQVVDAKGRECCIVGLKFWENKRVITIEDHRETYIAQNPTVEIFPDPTYKATDGPPSSLLNTPFVVTTATGAGLGTLKFTSNLKLMVEAAPVLTSLLPSPYFGEVASATLSVLENAVSPTEGGVETKGGDGSAEGYPTPSFSITGDFKNQKYICVRRSPTSREQKVIGEAFGRVLVRKSVRESRWGVEVNMEEGQYGQLCLAAVVFTAVSGILVT